MPAAWGAPWEDLSPTERKLFWLLGLGASWVWNNKKSSLILGYIWYRNPLLGLKLIRTTAVESVRYSARLGWGVGKDLAPEMTKQIEKQARRVKSKFKKPPAWLRWGSRVSKYGFGLNVFGTGIAMIAEQNRKAAAGEFGTSEVLGDALMEAEFNMEGDQGYSPTQRPVRIHRMGGPGGLIV